MNYDDKKLKRRHENDKYNRNKLEAHINAKSKRVKKSKLYPINLIFALALLVFIFIRGIFPLPYRIIFAVILLLLELILYKRVRKTNNRFFKNIIMLFIIVFSTLFIFLVMRLDLSLERMNKSNVLVPNKYRNDYSFNVYISGIDSKGDITTVSRSDVNIIATINTKTGDILLTTIARDSYFPIAGEGNNEYDKLTHAGLYGVKSSMETLENVFNIDIPYYARINFDSMVNIVDALGGIDVYNNQGFQSKVMDRYFEEGNLHLNGEEALAFVRERYNLAEGDADRGRNQEKVFAAMIKKAASPASLLRFEAILQSAEDSIDTNIPSGKAIDILNSQLFKFGKLNIESKELSGEGQYGLPSYAMPGYDLYMFVPYEESIQETRNNILETMRR